VKNNVRVIHLGTGGRTLLKLNDEVIVDMCMYSAAPEPALLACVTSSGDMLLWRLYHMEMAGGG
jgi:hypothetical protein